MDNKCEKCGTEVLIGMYPFCGKDKNHLGFKQTHGDSKSYPFVTKNFDGKPVEVTSAAHERELMRVHGVHKRDDMGWIEKEYTGFNRRTGKQEYKEGSGMGLPGCWF